MSTVDHGADFDASAAALDGLTTAAKNHTDPPVEHIHSVANHPTTHSWLQKIIPEKTLLDMENRWHLGNYVINRATNEKSWEAMSVYVRLGMHLLYYGSQQEKLLHTERALKLLEEQSVKMGVQYDDPASVNHIQPFIDSFQLADSMSEMVEPDPTKYKTFNDFFAREIKESARPIAEPEDDLVVSSPADCRLTCFPTIDLATKYWIKGFGFTLGRLLDNDELAKTFEGGSIVIARLAPQDYHRWHAPVSGAVMGINDIPGAYYTVNPQAINEPGLMDVFCENKRSIMMLKRTTTGSNVAIVAVGAMLVGSIFYMPGMEKEGTQVRRGQCIGGFRYGGSTVIVVLPKGETVMDVDLVKNSCQEDCETLMQVGWRVGGSPAQSKLA